MERRDSSKEKHGIEISVKSIYKILGEQYRLRRRDKINVTYVEVPKAKKDRDLVQANVVEFGEVYAYT
ncbi:MAG: hypothetical protein PHS44_06475 [Candidatus Dojkabacteria bacterium]|nr:hypothetical protein [Candidatus Dojkabacteria bacterium]